MKKSIFFFVLLCCFYSFDSLAQPEETTFEQKVKDLNIKSRSEYYVDLYSGSRDPDGYLSHVENYNKLGQMQSNIWYTVDGSIKRKQVFSYNDQGQKIEEQWFTANDSTNTYRLTFDYNDKGQMVHCRHYIGQDKVLFIYVQDFDEKGNVSTKYQFKRDSVLFIKTVYEREGNILRATEYNKSGGVRRQIIDRYTPEGDLASAEVINMYQEQESKDYYTYMYNDKQLLEEVKTYDESKKLVGIVRIVYDYYL